MVSRSEDAETEVQEPSEPKEVIEAVDWDKFVPPYGLVIGPEDVTDAGLPPVWVSDMDKAFKNRPCLAIVERRFVHTDYYQDESRWYRLVARHRDQYGSYEFARHWIIPFGVPREYLEYYKTLAPSAFRRIIEKYRGGEHGADYPD